MESFVDDAAAMLKEHFRYFEIVLVEDGSHDDTAVVVDRLMERHSCCRMIRLSRRFGTEVAIVAGLESAIGDFVAVLMPATDPPLLVPDMVDRCRGGAGVVTGIRRSREGERWYMRMGTAVFYTLANRALRIGIPRNSTHFKVFSRQVVNAVTRIPDQARFLRTLTTHVGYVDAHAPYDPIARRHPPRRKRLTEALALALRIVVANSLTPLYGIAALGAGLTAACLGYVLYVVVMFLALPEVATGWTSTNLVAATMFGVLAFMGTASLVYLARLLEERGEWPLYFVLEERGSSDAGMRGQLNVVERSEAQ